MSDPEPHEGYRISRALESADREIRMQKIRRDLEFRGGVFRESEGAPEVDDPSLDESFLESVLRFEEAPDTTYARLLLEDGIELPGPDELGDDEQVEEKLWEIINALAFRSVYLHHTNHLSDRKLYEALWRVHLNEATKDLSSCPGSASHLDILGAGTDEDNCLFLKFYADEEERAFWGRDWPEDEMPVSCDPPFDRDRHLPKRDF